MPKTTDKPKSFEAALSELETIVSAMESSELPLEQALAQYERGIRLLRYCDDTLAGAEQKIRVLENEQLVPLSSGEDVEE